MLTIICGEDEITARKYYSDLKKSYRDKGVEILETNFRNIDELKIDNLSDTSLFAEKKVYFTSGLNKVISRVKDKTALSELKKVAEDSSVMIVDWEGGKSARDLKIKTYGILQEFKPSESIFAFLDACVPGNKQRFINDLQALTQSQEEGFVYAMLCRHVRSLVMAKLHALPPSVQGWQKTKLTSQANSWETKKLVAFYEGLARIDSALKTGGNVYGVKKSLDILACYFL